MNKIAEQNAQMGLLIFVISVLGCIAVLGYQSFFYLRDGIWQSLSLISVANWMGSEWAANPRSWFGLHKILSWIPLSIGIVIIGIVSGLAASIQD